MKRYATVAYVGHDQLRGREVIASYLPSGYEVIGEVDVTPELDIYNNLYHGHHIVIGGEDFAGWTLDEYVIPRLASGLHSAREIDLSHPIMKLVPDDPR